MLGLGASDFEFGVDPSADPELALVRWGRSGCTHCAGQGTAGGPCGRPAQRRARPRVRRHCASPWRSRGSGKRRRPGGLRPLLQLKLGLQPPAGTVSGWAGGGGMCEGRGAAPAPWEAGAGCGTALHSSAAAGVPCGRQPLPRMLGRARAGASSAAATTPQGSGGGREGFGAAPGGVWCWVVSLGFVCADSDDALLKMTITQQEFGRAGLPDLSSMTEEEQIAYAMQMSLQGAGEAPWGGVGGQLPDPSVPQPGPSPRTGGCGRVPPGRVPPRCPLVPQSSRRPRRWRRTAARPWTPRSRPR